jgi:hypothetical protein
MRRPPITAPCLALFFGLLTACSGTPPPPMVQIKEVPQPVPAALLDCRPEPSRPRGDGPGGDLSDTQVAHLIVDLAAAGRDCRDKLGHVKNLIQPGD